jgi:hypothetical protein
MGDITMVSIIKVTDEDIATGVKGNSEKCPIGLAMTRQGIEIGDGIVTVLDENNKAKVFAFMEKFDAGQTVAPFEFTMRTETKPTLKY